MLARMTSLRYAVVVGFVACLARPEGANAQGRPIVARDDDARMEQLAPGVYAIIHADATTDWMNGVTEWPHSNTGVIVGDDAVLVVDATYLPSRARADIALIRSVTPTPVRYLVNTHWHGDHTHGNAVYKAAFPGLSIISQEANRLWIAVNQVRYPQVVAAGRSTKQSTIARLEALLRAGTDSAGTPLTAAQQSTLTDNIRRRRHELDELSQVTVVPPDVGFDKAMSIDLGNRQVLLENRGRANSPADVTVFLPAERVLFTGDILVYPVPYFGASHPLPWIDVLRSIEALPLRALVPGHGPVLNDHVYTTLVRELFEATRDRVRAAMEKGLLLADVVNTVDLPDFRARFLALPVPSIEEYWEGRPTLIERMHDCVQGYRC